MILGTASLKIDDPQRGHASGRRKQTEPLKVRVYTGRNPVMSTVTGKGSDLIRPIVRNAPTW